MEVITTELLNDFYILTKKDLSQYFLRVLDFFEGGDYYNLVEFYKGTKKEISSKPYTNLESLIRETKDILRLFESNSRQMTNSNWWELLEQIEEIDTRLQTTNHINRWSRSSYTSVSYTPGQVIDYTLNQEQTLEDLSLLLTNSSNPQDDWTDIAFDNNLKEEDYTTQGGNVLRVNSGPQNGSNFTISSVVDVIDGKSVYGKDLYKKLQFNEETEDLEVLSYDDTFLQSMEILAKLKKNDNPMSPDSGLQSTLVLGGTKVSFNFPVISRQLRETFDTDDSMKNFQITNLYFDQDIAYIDYRVTSRLDEVVELSTILG